MSNISQTRIDELRDKILPTLLPYGVRRVAIFGSVVRGETRADSDIDILVTLKPPQERAPIGLRWFGLAQELSRILEQPVDLVSDESLSPYIRPYVEQEIIVIYES